MSFNVRDSKGVFGPEASIEIPNGANAPTLVRMQIMEPATVNQTNAASVQNVCIFMAPPAPSAASGLVPLGAQYQVLGVQVCCDNASTGNCNLMIEKCTSGTALGSGANVLSAVINLANLTASTPASGTLVTNIDSLQLSPTDRLNAYYSAAGTGTRNVIVTLYIGRSQ